MKFTIILKYIVTVTIILSLTFFQTGCSQNKMNTKNEQGSIYEQYGASYKNKYYNRFNETRSIKIFDENTKQTSYVCQKKNCNHDKNDATCNSYGLNACAYVPTEDYLYVFAKEYNENQPGHIDRIDLKTGKRTKYADVDNFNDIYNAFLINNKIYFSDLLKTGGCSIKVFDIDKKTITFIANEENNKNIFAYIKGFENDTLYYREDYHGDKTINYNSDDYYLSYIAEYDFIGAPSWYKTYIVSTSLFTYDLKTNKKNNTVKNIDYYTFTYYDKALYYVDDSKKKAHRLDWITGKDELLFTSKEEMNVNMFGYNNTITFDTYIKKPTEVNRYMTEEIITGRILYDVSAKESKKFEFNNKDLEFISREHKLDNGFIVAFTTSNHKTIREAYISKNDYYKGKSNLIIINEE